ncbi:MAG TPA: hypothetical protein VIJ02_02260 [Thermoanaerobaculia bacterium]|jgi:hypothetical protein
MQRRSLVRLAAVLLLTGGISVALTPGRTLALATSGTVTACPSVKCLTETTYNQCISAGCTCDPRTDWCVPPPPPPPPPSCPAVSCLTETGYQQCVTAGCGCDPRTDACVPKKVVVGDSSDSSGSQL